ncbi:hypothetical protein V1520DRAFT_299690 [Lipomyces starkeyi]|uniref:Uncharacterized protein n=1 Tax=Lipomyces starkeyi NRRL Y-11557 TaxID=675824 RepID=A0A1E3PVZ6_LIPST|nr:hypothetical protein LIPSTDRAFT_120945 [Lipomyces starkeyi NRRL Y-11557]
MVNDSGPIADNSSSKGSWTPYFIPGFLLYALLCSVLRFRRRDAMHKKFNYTRATFSKMTNVDAQAIMSYLGELEFPKIFLASIQFALFKTYGIPTISELLVATKEFSTPENASKRYADTGILIGEFTSHHPQSDRVIKALARMNYIHNRYQTAGKIHNDDLLYTLSVFITEPIFWVERYEWRSMTDMEICAISTFWKSIGDAMGIKYDGRLSDTEWTDGLQFYEDIKAWALDYEEKYMIPAKSNKQTADELVHLLLFYVPKCLKVAASNLVGVLMGDHLRKAMIYPTPSTGYFYLASAIFESRRFLLRYLSLPRPSFMRVREVSDDPDPKTGRYHSKSYLSHPYYNKPGLLNRWGPEGWLVWALGGDVPGSRGDRYIPQGYLFEEVGPNIMKNKGLEETRAWEEKLRVERPVGCPFACAR